MPKLAVIYNACGLGRESPQWYKSVIASIYTQNQEDIVPVFSGCGVKPDVLHQLKYHFPDLLVINTQHVVPISVSFNVAVQEVVRKFGACEGYLYLDYGVTFGTETTAIKQLYDLFKSGPYSMVSARTDTDNGYHLWYGLGKFNGDESENDRLFTEGNFIVPIGKCVNLHAQIFSHELYEAYNERILPDIFAAYCMESVFSFLNAAIQRKWVVYKDLILHHEILPANNCMGFGQGWGGLDKMFLDQTPVLERIKPGIPFGMGYDESRGLVMHDNSQYDENGFCKNQELRKYISEYMFLGKEILDYSKISRAIL